MSPVSVPAIHAAVRRALDARLTRTALLQGALLVVVALALGWIASGGERWEGRTAVPLLIDLAALVGAGWIVWRLRRLRGAFLAEGRVSSAMEESTGLPSGVVQGALELSRDVPEGVSPSLVSRMQRDTVARLDRPVADLSGGLGRRIDDLGRQALRGLAVAVPLLVILTVVSPGRTLGALGGLAAPVGLLSGPELPPLVALDGDVEVLRGGQVAISVEAPLRDSATFHWQAAGDVARRETVEVIGGRGSRIFEDVSAPIVYRVETADGAVTPEFEIVPVDPLFVTDVTVRLEFPTYTGRSSEEYRGDLPPFLLPAGTVVRLEGRASRDLSRGALTAEAAGAGEGPQVVVDGTAFSAEWVPTGNGVWEWSFTDASGGAAAAVPQALVVSVLPDAPPQIRIAIPEPDILLPLHLRQPVVLEASDDYGLQELELVAWRVDALGEASPPTAQSIQLGGTPRTIARPLLDVTTWGLVPGDQVRYYARVVDIHPSGQEARTAEYVLRMPEADEMRRDAQMRLEEATERLEDLWNRAEDAAQDTRDLERQSQAPERSPEAQRPSDPNQASFEEREEVRSAIEDTQEMIAEADSLNAELERLAEALEEAGAADPEFDEDLDELQEILEEMGGQELQERMDQLLEELDQMDRGDAQQTLEELRAEQEGFQERLEEALERAKRAAVEQDFRNTTREAAELAEEQRALSDAMQEEDDASLRAEQQERLQAEAEEMAERMEALGDELLELGEQEAWQGLEEAREATEQAAGQMQQASRMAQSGEQEGAEQAAQQAAEQMDEAARDMMAAQQQMMAERAQAYETALRQTSQDALALARRQAEIQERMRGSTPAEMAEFRGDVAAVRQGLENLARNLDVAARVSGGDQRDTAERIGSAMEALDQALSSLDSGSSSRPSPFASSEEAIDGLNEVALSAIAAARALEENGQQSQSSSEEMMEQMQDLAQDQAEVNNQASQMMTMELPEQQMQQQMQQMAQQQQQIAADLGQMSDTEGEDGPLGDLEAMAQEAEAIAEELAGGRLEPETRRRQERLFHRLLDAGRSLRKEEESTERESLVPGEFERQLIDALSGDDLGLTRYPMPAASRLNRLPPAARALVLQYFQRLNAAAGGGAAPSGEAAGGAGGAAGEGPAGAGGPPSGGER